MSTCLGVSYSRKTGMSSEAEPTIAQLMQTLLADKKLREQELAEEKTRREQELKEERHQHNMMQTRCKWICSVD